MGVMGREGRFLIRFCGNWLERGCGGVGTGKCILGGGIGRLSLELSGRLAYIEPRKLRRDDATEINPDCTARGSHRA